MKIKITKEDKVIYKFLNMASQVLKNDNGEAVVFVEKGILYFGTWNISGYLKLTQNSWIVHEDYKDGFYEIFKTLKQDFNMNMLKAYDDEKLRELNQMKSRVLLSLSYNQSRYLCRIEEEESCAIAKISNETDKFLKDSYLGMIKCLKEIEVHENDYYILLKREQHLEKENMDVETVISLFCEKTKDLEFNQEKLEV